MHDWTVLHMSGRFRFCLQRFRRRRAWRPLNVVHCVSQQLLDRAAATADSRAVYPGACVRACMRVLCVSKAAHELELRN